MDVKALKLSKTMEDMIKAATLHQERVTDDIISGDVVIHGMRVMGRTNTIVALLDRGLVTAEKAGCNWLTEDGLAVRAALTGESLDAPPFHELGDDVTPEDHPTESDMITGARDAWINAREAAIEADNARLAAGLDDESVEPEVMEQMRADATDCDDCKGDHDAHVPCRIHRDPIAYSKHVDALMSDVLTNELPGDAERAWDAENAAMEAASVRDEYEGESVAEIINRVITADDIMIKTDRTFVSMNYLNTMRRIHADRADRRNRWKTLQATVIADMPNLFELIDAVYAEGKITFKQVDRERRRIRIITRPTLGSKHKPSKSRRNRH